MTRDEEKPGDRLRARYRALRAEGGLQPDPAQLHVIERLAALADALLDCAPPAPPTPWLDRLRPRGGRSRSAASTSTGRSGAANRC